MVNGRKLWNPSYRFLKECNLSTLSWSIVSDEWRSGRCLHGHGGLSSSRGHNEVPRWTVEQNRSPSNGNRYRRRSWEEKESMILCVKICKYGLWHLYICCSVFSILTFCSAEFDTLILPCGFYALFRLISFFRYVLKSLSIGFQGTKFEIFLGHISMKTQNHKPVVMLKFSVAGL